MKNFPILSKNQSIFLFPPQQKNYLISPLHKYICNTTKVCCMEFYMYTELILEFIQDRQWQEIKLGTSHQ